MAANELMEGESAFIEFGAGRGKLSHWIQKAMGENPTINYVLVDRSNCRRKVSRHIPLFLVVFDLCLFHLLVGSDGSIS